MKKRSALRIVLAVIVLIAITAVSALVNLNPPENAAPAASDTDIAESQSDFTSADRSEPVSRTELSKAEPLPPDCVTVQMGGDVLLHDSVVKAAKTGDSSYGHISNYLSLFSDVFVSDLNIVNLEGPTDAKGKNNGVQGYPVFNMPYEILTALKDINVDVCVTANNHTCDMGFAGVKKTVSNVKKAGMTPVGSYETEDDSKKCCIIEINNIKIGIAAFTTYTEGSVKSDKTFCVNKCGKSESKMLEAVKPAIDDLKANGAEFIIVSLHWGNEYESAPTEIQQNVAAQLCMYGADVIMGSHSHCVQPIELLTVFRGGKESKALVIYSLGNLFANQTGLDIPKTQEGMVVSIKAVRGSDGIVRLEDAFYMPTYTYVSGSRGKNFMKLVAAGEYASATEKPSFFKSDSAWKKCKNAWKNVNKTAGSAIPCVSDPSAYPAGFFAFNEEISTSDLA